MGKVFGVNGGLAGPGFLLVRTGNGASLVGERRGGVEASSRLEQEPLDK